MRKLGNFISILKEKCYTYFGCRAMNKIAKKILTTINKNGFDAYIVGGYVRDLLLGMESNDIDICTNAKGKDLIKMFAGKENGYGSFNFKINEYNIDITTFRVESHYEKRKPLEIHVVEDLKQDLERRDFTINGICMDKEGKVYDYFDGINDLNRNLIKAVKNPIIELEEDPLRILRAIRLVTVLDFNLDKNLEKAIIEKRELVKELSNYRIKEELSRILLSKNFQKGLDLFQKFHLDTLLDLKFVNIIYTKDLYGMWSQIDYNSNIPFTKNEKQTINSIKAIVRNGSITNEILYKYGLYLSLVAGEILKIETNTIYEMYNNMPIHERKEMVLSYNEIVNLLNLTPSQKVKEIEQEIIYEILHGHILNKKTDIKNYILKNKERWVNGE